MNVLSYLTPAILFPLLLLTALACFFGWYWVMLRRRTSTDRLLQGGAGSPALPRERMTFTARAHPMEGRDRLPLLALTLVYAATAFFRLGSTSNPQSFQSFTQGQQVEVAFSEPVYAASLFYYTGLGTGSYNVEISKDGSHWSTLWTYKDEEGNVEDYYWADAAGYEPSYALPQTYADLFKWETITTTNPQSFQYLRITAQTTKEPLELGELAILDQNGEQVDVSGLISSGNGGALFDEQDLVPEASSWFNSTYFDEIYHARTAYEHLRGIYPYEVSHPPLGKLILSVGIALFGMTPFGWRFMGTLFGVLMLPVLYVFLKNLFGKSTVAFCGTALFAFDFMHLTQTRIATIDTYAVFFILLMYYFLYRYLVLPAGTSFRKGAPWLFLSGLFWGIGAASKWTVIYGGVGLALLYFIGLYFKLRDWPKAEAAGERPVLLGTWLAQTLAFSVLCFVLLPAGIYVLSYLPYAAADGTVSLSNLLRIVCNNQAYMLSYHQGVHDTHPYESRWYQWVVDARPILYYMEDGAGYHTRFAAFSNPLVCWGGLLALLSVIVHMVRRRCGKALLIVVAYFSQLAPWFFIGRTTFAYHYFPSILFLCFALAYVINDILELGPPEGRRAVWALTGTGAGLYAAFYPVLIGLSIPTWYAACLRWFYSWPF